jgi:SAM-dependent methyltransferase
VSVGREENAARDGEVEAPGLREPNMVTIAAASMLDNPIFDLLCTLGVCDRAALSVVAERVRDREDVRVLCCQRSGVIALSRTDHVDLSHYDHKLPGQELGARQRLALSTEDDTTRRAQRFGNIVRGKRWLDFGTGPGAILDAMGPLASEYAGLEPQEHASRTLRELGHRMYRRIEEVPDRAFDVVTLFHVFEHLTDPLGTLAELARVTGKGGRIVIEVPHARDFLISFVDCTPFRAHTFWSEHLILHTRESLRALLRAGGFDVLSIEGVQRYPLANHLHWLAQGKPGGHVAWNTLRDARLDAAYGDVLARLDLSDTLVLEARCES